MRNEVLSIIVSVATLIGCGAGASYAQEAPARAEEVWPYLQSLPKEERLEVLEREAKREGSFTWYGSTAIDRAEVFIKLFNEEYPDVRVDFSAFSEPQVPEKLLMESRAGRVQADFILSSVTYLDMTHDLLAPYEPVSWEDFDPRFRFGGDAEGWTAMAFEVLLETIAWRTDRVTSQEAPKDLAAVADPKWKGRVGTTTYFERFIDAMIETSGEEPAMEQIKALAELDNRLYRNYAAASTALASGEVDLTWQMLSHRAAKLKGDGAPVDYKIQSPSFGLPNLIGVIKTAENPYAAALFLEFSTRPEVMEAMDKMEAGRAFGNVKGNYGIKLEELDGLMMYRPIPAETFQKYNRIGEELFIRRAR